MRPRWHDEPAGSPTGGWGREQKPHPELHQLLTKSGVFNLYPTKDLSPATDLMGLENAIPDTPTARQTTITLANVAR